MKKCKGNLYKINNKTYCIGEKRMKSKKKIRIKIKKKITSKSKIKLIPK
jgi:hypothetical protein